MALSAKSSPVTTASLAAQAGRCALTTQPTTPLPVRGLGAPELLAARTSRPRPALPTCRPVHPRASVTTLIRKAMGLDRLSTSQVTLASLCAACNPRRGGGGELEAILVEACGVGMAPCDDCERSVCVWCE